MNTNNRLSKELFGMLACPICKTNLNYSKNKKSLVCSKCKSNYPIKSGIPLLLPSSKK